MRKKYSAIIAIPVVALAITLVAGEKQQGTRSAQLVRLKSNGETVAELRILKGASIISISGRNVHSYMIGNRTIAKGDVTVEVRPAGGPAVVVKADEIEAAAEAQ